MPTTVLLHAIVRQMYQGLKDLDVLESLKAGPRSLIGTARLRTEQTVTTTTASGSENNFGFSGQAGSTSHKRTRSEWSSERCSITAQSAKTDIAEIAACLKSGEAFKPSAPWRGQPWHNTDRGGSRRVRAIVILDELDKLSGVDGGRDWLRNLVTGAKTMLTDSGVSFVLIGGDDVHMDV